jgi:hypothetical protein
MDKDDTLRLPGVVGRGRNTQINDDSVIQEYARASAEDTDVVLERCRQNIHIIGKDVRILDYINPRVTTVRIPMVDMRHLINELIISEDIEGTLESLIENAIIRVKEAIEKDPDKPDESYHKILTHLITTIIKNRQMSLSDIGRILIELEEK